MKTVVNDNAPAGLERPAALIFGGFTVLAGATMLFYVFAWHSMGLWPGLVATMIGTLQIATVLRRP